jgi:hypothetical protein
VGTRCYANFGNRLDGFACGGNRLFPRIELPRLRDRAGTTCISDNAHV